MKNLTNKVKMRIIEFNKKYGTKNTESIYFNHAAPTDLSVQNKNSFGRTIISDLPTAVVSNGKTFLIKQLIYPISIMQHFIL